MKKVLMIIIALVILAILVSCSPAGTNELSPPPEETDAQPEVTKKPTTLDQLKEMDPTYEIFFDGEECIVEGPAELTPGEYFFILHNQTDLPAILWLGDYFGEGSFDDHMLWREENCEGQGSHCENEEGIGIDYSNVRWMNAKKQANEGRETYYKLYEFSYQRQHIIYVASDAWWGWLCAPIQISN